MPSPEFSQNLGKTIKDVTRVAVLATLLGVPATAVGPQLGEMSGLQQGTSAQTCDGNKSFDVTLPILLSYEIGPLDDVKFPISYNAFPQY